MIKKHDIQVKIWQTTNNCLVVLVRAESNVYTTHLVDSLTVDIVIIKKCQENDKKITLLHVSSQRTI